MKAIYRLPALAIVATQLISCSGGGGASSLPSGPSAVSGASGPSVTADAVATPHADPGKSGGATPAPGSSSAPAPSAPGSFAGIVSGKAWPQNVQIYSASSPWNRPIIPLGTDSSNAQLIPNSAAMEASMQAGGAGDPILRTQEPGQWDFTHPVFMASNSDPSVTAHCFGYCAGTPDATIHVPAKARPAGGSDHHMAVVQPNGDEYDFWETAQNSQSGGNVSRDWQSGDTVDYAGGGLCSNVTTGSGIANGGGATAGGACLGAGRTDDADLQTGNSMNHAFFVTLQCVAAGVKVYPANAALNTGGTCSGSASSHVPMGARLWLDLTDAQIDALGLTAPERTVLKTWHHYGVYVMDVTNGCTQCNSSEGNPLASLMPVGDPPEEEWAYGAQPASEVMAQGLGWQAVSISGAPTPRFALADPWRPGVTLINHVHVVDPCYAQGTCG